MNELEKSTKYLKATNRGFFVALYEHGDGNGVQYRCRASSPETMLGIFSALTDVIMSYYVPKFGREAVIESLRGTLENTIRLHEENDETDDK